MVGRRCSSCAPWLRNVSWAAAVAIWLGLVFVAALLWPTDRDGPIGAGDAGRSGPSLDRSAAEGVSRGTEAADRGRGHSDDREQLPFQAVRPGGPIAQDAGDPPGDRQETRNMPRNDRFEHVRHLMVEQQLRRRDITDERVLASMEKVPRHLFVPPDLQSLAYADRALPIEHGQTISQPYIVALMTQWANVGPESKVLEIGTGSGYQAAVLAEICRSVFSIEIVESLALTAQQRLSELGYSHVSIRCGDGYLGWPDEAPFDAILVTAAPDHVPQPLIDQLAVGGRLIIPVGRNVQQLTVFEKAADGTVQRFEVASVLFVPMTGRAEEGPSPDEAP